MHTHALVRSKPADEAVLKKSGAQENYDKISTECVCVEKQNEKCSVNKKVKLHYCNSYGFSYLYSNKLAFHG